MIQESPNPAPTDRISVTAAPPMEESVPERSHQNFEQRRLGAATPALVFPFGHRNFLIEPRAFVVEQGNAVECGIGSVLAAGTYQPNSGGGDGRRAAVENARGECEPDLTSSFRDIA